jgi:hypothetical protein
LPDACAGPEVESVSKMYLEDLEQIDKSPSKCRQTRDPQTMGHIPKRLEAAVPGIHNVPLASFGGTA